MQAGQGDAEAHRVQVAAQRLDLAAQRVELLGALQDQGVDLLAARGDVVGLLSVAQDLDVGTDGAHGLAQGAQAGREGLDLAGPLAQEVGEPLALLEDADQPGGLGLDPAHGAQDSGHGALGLRAVGDADAVGQQLTDLGDQHPAGEVDGVGVAQGLQLGLEGGLPGGGHLPAGGAGRGGGLLDVADPGVGGLDVVTQVGEHRQGAHRQVAGAGGHDRGEDPVVAVVGGAVGDVGAGGPALLDGVPDGAEQAGGHVRVPHHVVSPPHQGAARVAGQAHEGGVGTADAPVGVRGGEEELVGGEDVLDVSCGLDHE